MAVIPGDILRRKYRIDSLIGRGGMGQVFAATDMDSLHTQVAVKVVSRLMIDDVMMARLHREAEAAQRIQSDWVPRVVEVGDTDDGETFLVMERLIGESLSARLREHGVLEWPEVARIGEDVLRALIDAHTGGVVHRDLKPSNVFLALKAGRVRAMVLDFGVCKVDGVDVERLTGTGESIGTVAYMAPEQIRGAARVDERADLYAFGVLVFEMLTGRLPHEGPSQMAILASKLENPAGRLANWARVLVPEGADELIARTLAREPRDRFANAQDLLKAWRNLSKTDKLVASTPPPPIVENASANANGAGPDDITLGAPPYRRHSSAPPPFGSEAPPSAGIDRVEQDPHPTQNALTTQGGSPRSARNGRLARVLAAIGLAAGIVVVVVAYSRGRPPPAPPKENATQSEPPPDEPAPSPDDSAAIELPDEPPSVSSSSPAPVTALPPVVRPRLPRLRYIRPPPGAAPPPKTSGPHITSQPRY